MCCNANGHQRVRAARATALAMARRLSRVHGASASSRPVRIVRAGAEAASDSSARRPRVIRQLPARRVPRQSQRCQVAARSSRRLE